MMDMGTGGAAVLEQCRGLGDDQVVARVLTGQTALFEVLMRRHNQRLYRTARAITGDDQAEEVMQQAYVTAYARLREYEGNDRFATWLARILVTECVARVGHTSRNGSAAAAPD